MYIGKNPFDIIRVGCAEVRSMKPIILRFHTYTHTHTLAIAGSVPFVHLRLTPL